MKNYVYILYSESTGRFYKGQTNNISNRLSRHNNATEIATSWGIPWVMLWFTEKENRSEAMILEKKLKNLGRERTIAFIQKYSEGIRKEDVEAVRIINDLVSSSS
ncbi:MAG: excinuclease ABC subunit C [Bacteroidetes bacterium HGW-Bacteroidetes-21]|jgi:putative endonuclease|nr:MAG: excinuclease ABC subunit C [Bacteroidetes bacterium HGW-Bacteroidetes-21]